MVLGALIYNEQNMERTMPILHKDLSRLSRDAKELRKHLKQNSGHNILAQESLDLVARFFGWDNWNSLFIAHKNNTDAHTWWHDMRWREKTQYIENHPSSKAVQKGDEVAADNDFDFLSFAAKWLRNRFLPPKNALNSKTKSRTPFFGGSKSTPYSNIHRSRFREGLELVCPDTLTLTQHIGEHFLPAVETPGLIIFCQMSETLDFARMLNNQGYNTSMISDACELDRSLNIESKPLQFLTFKSEDAEHCDIDQYLHSLKQHIPDGYRVHIVVQYIDFIINLRIFEASKSRWSYPSLHTIEDIINIYQTHESEEIRLAAKSLMDFLPITQDEIENIIKGNASARCVEQWQYITMQVSEALRFIQGKCAPVLLDHAVRPSEIERPQKKEAILFPISCNVHTHRVHLSIINDMLMSSFSNSPFLIGSDDIFILVSNTLRGTGPVEDGNLNLKFINHNRARANVVFYGVYDRCSGNVDTQSIVDTPSEWTMKDLRLKSTISN